MVLGIEGNMEQEFREWVKTQKTQQGNYFTESDSRNFAKYLSKTIPEWIDGDSIFNITNTNIIEELYGRCLKGGNLHELNEKKNNMDPSRALYQYKKFLEQKENPKTEENMTTISLQKIYDEAIRKKDKNFEYWFPRYEKAVKKFIDYAKNNEWDEKSIEELIFAKDNSIANFGQGFIHNEDKGKIDDIFDNEFVNVLKEISENKDITNEQYKYICEKFGPPKLSRTYNVIRNRLIASFLPNVVTTTANTVDIDELVKNLQRNFADYPKEKDGWLYKNKNFIKYVNDKVEFQHEWHSSVFAWHLHEYFQNNKNIVSSKTEESIMNKSNLPLNQILFGPPGTGKTYSTVGKALEILEATDEQKEGIKSIGELKEVFGSQVEFVTFHQSFSYEDFVEGLKAQTDDGKIAYEVKSGIFKQICKNASSKAEITNDIDIGSETPIWKMSIGGKHDTAEQYFDEALETDSLVLGWGDDVNFSGCENRQEIHNKFNKEIHNNLSQKMRHLDASYFVDTFKNKMKIGDIVIISDGNYRFKAIAKITGEYYFDSDSELPQKRKIKLLQRFSESKSASDISAKNFTQTTINKPKHIDREKLKNCLKKTKNTNEQKPHILIIDEINRGNISRIFGELITLIEPSKRAGAAEEISVKLPYSNSKDDFSVPKNLHIIGTMNTADRSLAKVDIALRRRFDFIEMMPRYNLPELQKYEEVNLPKMLEAINVRICQLLDREHQIGHSFFMRIKSFKDLKEVFKFKILPLLEEYFFDDWDKIKKVLNDNKNAFYKKNNNNGEFQIKDEENNTPYAKCDVAEIEIDNFKNIYQVANNTPQEESE